MSLRRRAGRLKRVPPPAAPRDAKLADSNDDDDDSGDDDNVEVYMLAESQRFYSYRKECPPFVRTMARRNGLREDRKAVVLADDDGCRPDESDCQRSELVSHVYAPKAGFWTLELGGVRMIVKAKAHGNGAAYVIWWGPEEGFGEKAVAFSPRAPRGEVRGWSDGETEQPDHDSHHEPSDEENEFRSVDATQPSSMRRNSSRNAKDKGQAKIKRLIAGLTGTDRGLTTKRPSQQLRVLLEQHGQAEPVTNKAARANRPSLPTPRRRLLPSPSTSDIPLAQVRMKRERSVSEGAARQPPKLSTRLSRQRLRSPPVQTSSHNPPHLPSKNDNGSVPFYLHSCMTIETLFASALSVWRLRGKDEDVAALTVRFDWLKKAEAMIIMREVADSFQKMLETIAEAPVWLKTDETRKSCDVRVGFVVRER